MKDQICDPRGSARALSRWLVLAAVFSAVLSTSGESVVLPSVAENESGFGQWGWNRGYSARVQQVVNPQELSAAMPNGALINGLRLRNDDLSSPYQISFDSVEVRLSTSAARADGLSETFSLNVGIDETLVYSTGPVRWVFTYVQGRANSFDAVMPFMTPFPYDPKRGALLIDITFINPSNDGRIDVHYSPPGPRDGFSAVAADLISGPDLNAGFAQSLGLVMRLDFTPIPEPSVVALLVLGSCLLLLDRTTARAREP